MRSDFPGKVGRARRAENFHSTLLTYPRIPSPSTPATRIKVPRLPHVVPVLAAVISPEQMETSAAQDDNTMVGPHALHLSRGGAKHPREMAAAACWCYFHEDPQNRMELIKGNPMRGREGSLWVTRADDWAVIRSWRLVICW